MPADDPLDSARTGNQLLAHFSGWPTKPRKLHSVDFPSVLALVGDVLMLLLALAFVGAYPRFPLIVRLPYHLSFRFKQAPAVAQGSPISIFTKPAYSFGSGIAAPPWDKY